jgi:hypothetical protein
VDHARRSLVALPGLEQTRQGVYDADTVGSSRAGNLYAVRDSNPVRVTGQVAEGRQPGGAVAMA